MIVTLTLNPSLDRTLEVGSLVRGAVIRAEGTRLDPGGKGVNVTRALLANGLGSRAVIPCGGPEGEQLARLLAADSVPVVAVPISGRTRSNVTLVEPDGTVTKVNEPGAALTREEFDRVAEAVLGCAGAADWVVICGSLPPQVAVDAYAGFTRQFTAAGIRVAVDSSGPALLAALAAGPDLVKPNREELAEAVGGSLDSLADVVEAAHSLRALGARAVLASLGADGAVLVDAHGAVHARGPAIEPRSAVGAGDALLAGFLSGGGSGTTALAEAVAWGTAAAGLPGSRMPGPGDIMRDGVRLRAVSMQVGESAGAGDSTKVSESELSAELSSELSADLAPDLPSDLSVELPSRLSAERSTDVWPGLPTDLSAESPSDLSPGLPPGGPQDWPDIEPSHHLVADAER